MTAPSVSRTPRTAVVALSRPAYAAAVAAIVLGIVAAIAEAIEVAFTTTTSGTGPYQYAADYWLTANALPVAGAAIMLLPAVRALQRARDGRLGLAGIWVNTACLLVLAGICAAALAAGHDIQGGPTYILGTLGTLVGTALFAAGSWRAGLLPRWLLAIWPIVWVIGSFAAVSASPLLLAAFYGALLLTLVNRVRA